MAESPAAPSASGFFMPSCRARTRAARSWAVSLSSASIAAGSGWAGAVSGGGAAGSACGAAGVRCGAAGARLRRTSTCTVRRPPPVAPARICPASTPPRVSLLPDRLSFFVLPLSSLIVNPFLTGPLGNVSISNARSPTRLRMVIHWYHLA